MMHRKNYVLLILIISILCTGCGANSAAEVSTEVSQPSEISVSSSDSDKTAAKKYPEGSTATVMMYIVGSDLESDSGSATMDISEMLDADTSNINVVLQTGGTKTWQNDFIKDGIIQRHIFADGTIETVEDVGEVPMVTEEALTDFLKWSVENYPADRYMLIFWDHGGGTLAGFGTDEFFPEDTLMLSNINDALEAANVHFDFVGYDACLMGSVENAYMLRNYADYMIASEEIEPTTGWYYTKWLTELSKDTSISTEELGKIIVDGLIEGPDATFFDTDTLSVIDLSQIDNLYTKLGNFMHNSIPLLESGYDKVSKARSKSKDFGLGEYDQIDIMTYIKGLSDVEGADELKEALEKAVVYSNSNIGGANGLSMYYPYYFPEYYSDTTLDMQTYSFDGYEDYFDKFLSIMTGGQIAADGLDYLNSPNAEDFDASIYSWFDSDYGSQYSSVGDYEELEIIDKGDYYALSLSDEEWESVTDIALQMYIDDGEGLVDLGMDNVYEFDDDGDLKIEFDSTWVALNGQIVPFYTEFADTDENGSFYTYGYVPATLNDEEEIEIIVYWGAEAENGYVAGYRPKTGDGSEPMRKGLKDFKDGDYIDLSCDYYSYDGEYANTYSFGGGITVDGEIAVSYEELSDVDVLFNYKLTDTYNNTYATEKVIYNL